ncbi:MAG: hypoxanthine phosphoribosyltransferase [Salinibacter sp.]
MELPEGLRALIPKDTLRRRVRELGAEITQEYRDIIQDGTDEWPLLAIGVLSGASIFMADLVREIDLPLELEHLTLTSYRDGTEPGELQLDGDFRRNIAGRHVLVVEDLIDTGRTLRFLREHLRAQGPASVGCCCLLDKTPRREIEAVIDHVGFQLDEDFFVVGYGIDYAGQYRNLPYVAALCSSGARSGDTKSGTTEQQLGLRDSG